MRSYAPLPHIERGQPTSAHPAGLSTAKSSEPFLVKTFPAETSPTSCRDAKPSSIAWRAPIVRRIRSLLHSGRYRHRRHPRVEDCVKAAVSLFTTLRRAGASSSDIWIAVGRLMHGNISVDHSWVVQRSSGNWWVQDPTGIGSCAIHRAANTQYAPLAFLDEERLVLAGRPGLLKGLAPAFFWDVHLGIVNRALDGLVGQPEIAAINAMNYQADTNGYDPREHCDDGALLESLQLAEDRLAWHDNTTPKQTVVDAPRTVAYGLAYHAIADLYAHTNFVPAAAAFYGGLNQAKAFDLACTDAEFLEFLQSPSWSNEMLWLPPKGYSCKPFPFSESARHALVSGAYPQTPGHPKDGWYGRDELPIHDQFAIDQPDSALVHEDPIVPREHPFAFPYVWGPQFAARERLATEHLRRVAQRLQSGDPNPLLGTSLNATGSLFLPEWTLQTGQRLSGVAFPQRDSEGRPVQPWGP